jgi:D-serine deaminase-like pyridoxal phosphate-dependent protein
LAQVFGADLGQPGQASRRASELHQGGDAVAVSHLGGPQQHPAHSQDPQPGPGGAEADIYYNAIADDGMACHGTQSTAGHQGSQQAQVPIRMGRKSPAQWLEYPAPEEIEGN